MKTRFDEIKSTFSFVYSVASVEKGSRDIKGTHPVYTDPLLQW